MTYESHTHHTPTCPCNAGRVPSVEPRVPCLDETCGEQTHSVGHRHTDPMIRSAYKASTMPPHGDCYGTGPQRRTSASADSSESSS